MPIEDELPALPEDVAAALAAERPIPPVPVAARERIWASVSATVGLPPAGPASPSAARPASPMPSSPPMSPSAPTSLPAFSAAARGGSLGKTLALTVAGGFALAVIAAAGYRFSVGDSAAGPAIAPAAATHTASDVAAARSKAPPASAAAEAVTATAIPAAGAGANADTGADNRSANGQAAPPRARPIRRFLVPPAGVATERELLEEARSALGAGKVRAALAAVERHEARFPAGQLVEEREAIRVRALASAGDPSAARASAQRFAARFPRSIFLPAVESTLRDLPAE